MNDDAHIFTGVPSETGKDKASIRRLVSRFSFSLLIAAVPVAVVLASLRWRSLDRWWTAHPTASWFLQILLTTLFVAPLANVISRTWRRQRAVGSFISFINSREARTQLVQLFLDIYQLDSNSVAIAVIADDGESPSCVDSCGIACVREKLLPVVLSAEQLSWVVKADDVSDSIIQIRKSFLELCSVIGLANQQSLDFWNIKLNRNRVVVIGEVKSTDALFDDESFSAEAQKRMIELQRRGIRMVLIGGGHSVSVLQSPILIDTTAVRWSRAHLARPVNSFSASSDHEGARFLIEILDPYLSKDSSVREDLERICRLHRPTFASSASERIEAAARLLSSHSWQDEKVIQWILNILVSTTRGIDIVAVAIARHDLEITRLNLVEVINTVDSSFLSRKQVLTLSPNQIEPSESFVILDGLSRSQRLDVIGAMERTDVHSLALLAHLATHTDLLTRFAAATKFSTTVSASDDPNLDQLMKSWLPSPDVGGIDTNYNAGALGWIIPSLMVRFPETYGETWETSVRAASQRDPSHMQLSIARGLCLTAQLFPSQTLKLLERVTTDPIGFWLTDLKLVHAAGIAASALGQTSHDFVLSRLNSKHALVRESAEIVVSGLHHQTPVDLWTWGLESFETRSTEWSHNPRTQDLLARVALAAGLFWNSISTSSFSEIIEQNHPNVDAPQCVLLPGSCSSLLNGQCQESCKHGMCSQTLGLTQLSNNYAEAGKAEFGIAFCLDRARASTNSSRFRTEKQLWLELASASYAHGKL